MCNTLVEFEQINAVASRLSMGWVGWASQVTGDTLTAQESNQPARLSHQVVDYMTVRHVVHAVIRHVDTRCPCARARVS